MTGPLSDVGPSTRADVAVRGLFLAVLFAGLLTVAGSVHPAQRQQADLAADLSAGRVAYLEYDHATLDVLWTDSWGWSWRRTQVNTWQAVDGQQEPDVRAASLTWLEGRAAASPHPVEVRTGGGSGTPGWTGRTPWTPLRYATQAAWLLTLLRMLTRRGHRYANRWAWFWLFTVGQAGAFAYLALEPWPLGRPASLLDRRVLVRGGTGLVVALLTSFAISVALVVVAGLG